MGTLGTQRGVVTVPGVDDRRVRIDVEHSVGDVAVERVELVRFCYPSKTAREQAVTCDRLEAGGQVVRAVSVLDNRDTPLATVNRTKGSTAVSTFDGSLPPAKVKQRQSIPAIYRSLFYGKFTVA